MAARGSWIRKQTPVSTARLEVCVQRMCIGPPWRPATSQTRRRTASLQPSKSPECLASGRGPGGQSWVSPKCQLPGSRAGGSPVLGCNPPPDTPHRLIRTLPAPLTSPRLFSHVPQHRPAGCASCTDDGHVCQGLGVCRYHQRPACRTHMGLPFPWVLTRAPSPFPKAPAAATAAAPASASPTPAPAPAERPGRRGHCQRRRRGPGRMQERRRLSRYSPGRWPLVWTRPRSPLTRAAPPPARPPAGPPFRHALLVIERQ